MKDKINCSCLTGKKRKISDYSEENRNIYIYLKQSIWKKPVVNRI